MRAGLEERLRAEIAAEFEAKAEADFDRMRRHLYEYLSKSARSEAEAALHKDRRELDGDRADLQAEEIHLEAWDATITARENTWTRQRNRAIALGTIPAVVLTATIQAVL